MFNLQPLFELPVSYVHGGIDSMKVEFCLLKAAHIIIIVVYVHRNTNMCLPDYCTSDDLVWCIDKNRVALLNTFSHLIKLHIPVMYSIGSSSYGHDVWL